MTFIRNRWAWLRLRFDGPFTRVRCRDSGGLQTDAGWSWYPSDYGRTSALLPIARRIGQLAADLPAFRTGQEHTGPVPLAVFLDLPEDLWQPAGSPRLTLLLDSIRGETPANKIQFVRFAGSLHARRPVFALPFDILSVGQGAQAALSLLRNHNWVNDPAVLAHGFAITSIAETEPSGVKAALGSGLRDIVIGSDVGALLRASREVDLPRRPRLVISLESGSEPATTLSVPAGTALIRVHGAQTFDPALGDLILGLVHDLPLHDAVKNTHRNRPESRIDLHADPHTNQSLRMRDALVGVQTAVERIETQLPVAPVPTDVEFIELVDFGEVRTLGADLKSIRAWPAELDIFSSESDGLVPLSRATSRLEKLTPVFTSRISAPQIQWQQSADEERVIDVALQRLDTRPILSAIQHGESLAAEALYRLRVHAGARLPESLVVGEPPPIGQLLPPAPDGGHLLDVVIQAKTFGLESAQQQQMRLPLHGGGLPVYFTVRAPAEMGPASLRVHIYYQTHLIQSFELTAFVTADEGYAGPETGIRLVHSRVDRLILDSIQPRRLSVGVNRSDAATHDLVFKTLNKSTELTLASSAFNGEVERFRATLDRASRDAVDPMIPRKYPRLAPGDPPGGAVADLIRALAAHGRELYVAVLTKVVGSDPALHADLRALQDEHDQKIQVVRFDETFVFPWALNYDYELPDNLATAPVCLGRVVGSDGAIERCDHKRDSPVVCVNGFWGVRHYVEELIRRTGSVDSVSRAAKDAVRLVCDARLAGTTTLVKALTASIGLPHLAVGPEVERTLLDLLWQQPSARPSILVLLGHMDTASPPPRVVLAATEFLTRKRLQDRLAAAYGQWDQPRPIVLLMACESAATNATTVNDFVSVLYAAGAAAIIGTEIVVSGDFAADAARRLTESLWGNATLGEAMTTLRREVLAEGNPLAFLFHAVGNVDLTIV